MIMPERRSSGSPRQIEADPNYATAYAWRVCAASWLPEFDIGAGERDICRALELDPWDPEANRILGFIEYLKGNFDQAKSLSLKCDGDEPNGRLHQMLVAPP